MKIYGGRYLDENDLRRLGISQAGDNVLVHEHVNLVGLENMEFGNNVRIDPYTTVVAAKTDKIVIGNYVHIGPGCSLVGSYGIEMGDLSMLSHGVRIFSSSDDYSGDFLTNPTVPEKYKNVTTGKVVIGRHSTVGAGAIVLPNITIAEGAAIGALSLVNRSVEPWGIYAGIPAKLIRERKKRALELENKLHAASDP